MSPPQPECGDNRVGVPAFECHDDVEVASHARRGVERHGERTGQHEWQSAGFEALAYQSQYVEF
jgi:hypothetical protein